MSFTIKDTKRKEPASYKSLYLKDNLIKEINKIAIEKKILYLTKIPICTCQLLMIGYNYNCSLMSNL